MNPTQKFGHRKSRADQESAYEKGYRDGYAAAFNEVVQRLTRNFGGQVEAPSRTSSTSQ